MKARATSPSTSKRESNVTDWMRELWEVEAQHNALVGSRLKFGLPLAPARTRRKATRKSKACTSAGR